MMDRLQIEILKTTPNKLKEYLDVYEGVRSEILYTTKFNENSDLGTTYLGRIDMTC